jgi:integrase
MTMEYHHNSTQPTLIRTPWNKGKLIGAKPPLLARHVWSIRTRLQIEPRTRDLAMFNLAIDSKLRGCDLVGMKVEAPNGYALARAKDRASGPVRIDGAGPPSRWHVHEGSGQAARRISVHQPTVPPRGHDDTQYARLVTEWIAGIGLDPHVFGTHSLRRTKATLIYRRTGNLRAVQLLLGHTKMESTVRYLGIEVDDALAIAEQVEVWNARAEQTCSARLLSALCAITGREQMQQKHARQRAG